ncbi:MAG: 2-amino-4-hydroxy-6-hydroxymethyldihydropteridine diphosphokinase [Dehalococcoidia bacterium]|nr:2-amino-4-hydroxy-6-hydroxymethyldihydropteridine diphosphokinase [Dehalococcoidia bacterium]
MKVYLGLGSNLGDRKANLEKALQLLSERLAIEQISSLYETAPVGHEEQSLFLNVVCRTQTDLEPFQLLSLIKGIEVSLGRVPSFPNAPRPIDVDILFYGDLVMETPELTIPHPRIKERAFVLIPLFELDAALLHPPSGERISALAARVPGREGVRKMGKLIAMKG